MKERLNTPRGQLDVSLMACEGNFTYYSFESENGGMGGKSRRLKTLHRI